MPTIRADHRTRRRVAAVAALALTALLGASACSGERPHLADDVTPRDPSATTTSASVAPTPTTEAPLGPGESLVAEAVVPNLVAYTSPEMTEVAAELANPTDVGGPLVFLVAQRTERALEVHLPLRPNGSKGWVEASDVSLAVNPYKITVRLSSHELVLEKDGEVVRVEPVGLGKADVPTPGGVFYIKELLQPPNPKGAYGPFAYGLSGFSTELTDFEGGEGVIGIHGTNDPSSVGIDSSHGCIRMHNDTITELTEILPLGTPVEIVA
ncbi:MAG: L,D-transpeptidase [Acidimicrobiia bacterium]